MHLLIDGQALQTSSSRQRGIGRYSSNLLRALAVARPSWRIEFVQNSALMPIAADDLNGLPVLPFQPPVRPNSEHHQFRKAGREWKNPWRLRGVGEFGQDLGERKMDIRVSRTRMRRLPFIQNSIVCQHQTSNGPDLFIRCGESILTPLSLRRISYFSSSQAATRWGRDGP
jgi:hypothetical protein